MSRAAKIGVWRAIMARQSVGRAFFFPVPKHASSFQDNIDRLNPPEQARDK